MLDTVNTMLSDMLGPFGPLIAVGVLGLFMILLTLPLLLRKTDDPLDRLKSGHQPTEAAVPEARLRQNQKKDKLEKYSDFLEPKSKEEYSAVRLKLLQAGYQSANAVRMYHFAQFALGFVLLVLGVIYVLVSQATCEEVTTQTTILAILLLNEQLQAFHAVAFVLVVAGIILMGRGRRTGRGSEPAKET